MAVVADRMRPWFTIFPNNRRLKTAPLTPTDPTPDTTSHGLLDEYRAALQVIALTDVGMRRRNNQDSLAYHLADGRAAWERSGHLFVVADGMGAHAAGELASRLAVDLVQHHYEKQQLPHPMENLRRALVEANNEIYRRGQANMEFRHMGTTCSALVLAPEGAFCAHVGDSRIYRLRGEVLEQWTFDHSLAWELQASQGARDDKPPLNVPKNVITRSLGPNPVVAVDLEGPFWVQPGDKFLLCSDGLSGQMTDEEIGVLLQLLPIHLAAQAMLDLANLRGGPDNISLIAVEVTDPLIATPSQAAEVPLRSRNQPVPIANRYWILMAISTLAAMVFWVVGQWPIASLLLAIGVVLLIVGVAHRPTQPLPVVDPSQPGGRAPYRRYLCRADSAMCERLAGLIAALQDAAAENHWSEAAAVIDRLRPEADQAAERQDFPAAVSGYARLTIEAMKSIRLARKS